MRKEFIDVDTGQIVVQKGQVNLRASAIGSCIVVTAFDKQKGISGLVHIMLPDSAPPQASEKTRYANDGIQQMFLQMTELGSRKEDVDVCLIGAANILRRKEDTICENNIRSVTSILYGMQIPVKASVLGGYDRRSACLDGLTGCVHYTEDDRPPKILWQPAISQ